MTSESVENPMCHFIEGRSVSQVPTEASVLAEETDERFPDPTIQVV
jgi:hypothetical protein